MSAIETFEEFCNLLTVGQPQASPPSSGNFKLMDLDSFTSCNGELERGINFARRDFYAICLIRSPIKLRYSSNVQEISSPALLFFSPLAAYGWECMTKRISGVCCVFRESFFTERLKSSLSELPMFNLGAQPHYQLNTAEHREICGIFGKMAKENFSDYCFKHDLLVSYVTEIIHFALKRTPSPLLHQRSDANARITAIFSDLLESQFPISLSDNPFSMRSAKDFAERLYVHVNHLNRAIKETTGKTTSIHIAERIASEAKVMLRHSKLNISQISYVLGFEEPAHFNRFFKKHTSQTPGAFRAAGS